MRMEQLLYLIEISKCKSMSVASEKLYLTPQALSISIKNLEEELGTQLLTRTNKGTSLTEKGWLLTKLTKNFLYEIDTSIKTPPKNESQFHLLDEYQICSTHGGANTFYPKLMVHFLQTFPNTKLHIDAMPFYEVYKYVKDRKYPFAFFEQYTIKGDEKIKLESSLEFHPLFQYQLSCQCPITFPIAKCNKLTIEQITKYPFIEPVDDDKPLPSIMHFFKDYGMPPKIIPVNNAQMVKEVLSSGLGLAIDINLPFQNPDRFRLENVKNIPLENDVKIEFGYIVKKGIQLSTIDNSFINYIINHLNDILTKNT